MAQLPSAAASEPSGGPSAYLACLQQHSVDIIVMEVVDEVAEPEPFVSEVQPSDSPSSAQDQAKALLSNVNADMRKTTTDAVGFRFVEF